MFLKKFQTHYFLQDFKFTIFMQIFKSSSSQTKPKVYFIFDNQKCQ